MKSTPRLPTLGTALIHKTLTNTFARRMALIFKLPTKREPANKMCVVDLLDLDENMVMTNKKCILNYNDIIVSHGMLMATEYLQVRPNSKSPTKKLSSLMTIHV